jgi:NitT/TauT family transport system substrate-binding protein
MPNREEPVIKEQRKSAVVYAGGRRWNRAARLLAGTLTLSVVVACGGSDGAGADAPGDTASLRLLMGSNENLTNFATYVGKELGYFEEERIEFAAVDSGQLTETIFLDSGQADISYTGFSEILQAVQKGVDLRAVYEYKPLSSEGVLVLEDSDIDEMADLVGKTVGLASDSDRASLNVAMREAGLDQEAVRSIITGDSGAVIAQALQDGTIAAMVGSPAEVRSLAVADVHVRNVIPESVASNPTFTFIAMESYLQKNRDVLVRFLRAWAKATHAGLHKPDAVVEMAKIHAPQSVENPDIIEISHEQAKEQAALGDDYGALRPEIWKTAVRQLVETGDLDGQIDVSSFLDDSLIAEVNDWDRAEVEREMEEWKAGGS